MATVSFEHVTKRFDAGSAPAVEDFNLEIEEREFLVLVGPSGCGKSTTLRLLAGLEEITAGTIKIGDRVVNRVPARDRDIAMVFQNYALYPHMSVRDNMAFGLSLRKVPKTTIRERVEEAARILGIENLLKRKPRQLSGGQRQRVALGRAIVRDPAVFLLDEPLSNLDAKLRVQTRAELSKLHHRLGTTFVYVTHDQVEAMTMATRLAVMNLGRLQQVGTPAEVYDHPVNMFVAGFIGSPAINFLDMQVASNGESLALEGAGYKLPVPAAHVPSLMPYAGRTLVAGIRPEDIHDASYRPPGFAETVEVRARVTVVEHLGAETILYATSPGGAEFVARVDARTDAEPDRDITLGIEMAKMHAFDPETTLAIREGPGASAAPAASESAPAGLAPATPTSESR